MTNEKGALILARDALEKNMLFMNRHKNGMDFFEELYDENHDALAALNEFIGGVPDLNKHGFINGEHDYIDDDLLDDAITCVQHLHNGIKGKE